MQVSYTAFYYADIGATIEIHCNTIRATRAVFEPKEIALSLSV